MGFFSWKDCIDNQDIPANVGHNSAHPNTGRIVYQLLPDKKISGIYNGYGDLVDIEKNDMSDILMEIAKATFDGKGYSNNVFRTLGINIDSGYCYQGEDKKLYMFCGFTDNESVSVMKEVLGITPFYSRYDMPLVSYGDGKLCPNELKSNGEWKEIPFWKVVENKIGKVVRVKLTHFKNARYEESLPSKHDPLQGFFYGDEDIDQAIKYAKVLPLGYYDIDPHYSKDRIVFYEE